MWLAGAKVCDLYLGTRLVALCQGQHLIARQPVSDAEAGLALAARWLSAQAPRAILRIWLSGSLCRPFVVESVQGLRGQDEIHKIMQAQAQRVLGRHEPCRVWLERAPQQGQRIAVAAAEPWLGQIEQTMRRWPVKSIAPWWADVLRDHAVDSKANVSTCKRTGMQVLAVHDCDSLTILVGGGQGFALVRTVAPIGDAIGDAVSARSALSRLLLSQDLPEASTVWVALMAEGSASGALRPQLALSPLVEPTP